MGEVPLCDIESRVQGAGGVHSELVLLRVYMELLESMAAPSHRNISSPSLQPGYVPLP